MWLLPYRQFTIETSLAPEQVETRLRDAIEPVRTFRLSPPERPLTGRLDGMAFDVMRSVRGRNSFRPRVRGVISPMRGGTRITGTMRLHDIVVVFVGAFVAMAGFVFLSGAALSVTNRQLEPMMLGALALLVFLFAMTVGGFVVEARRTFEELTRLVGATRAEMSS